MTYSHTWFITGVFGHPLNNACVCKVVAALVSSNGTTTKTSEHTFYLAPNVLPDDPSDGTVWVSSLPDFVEVDDLTEDLLWGWIDRNENRPALEAANERQIPAVVELDLPFVVKNLPDS